MHCPNVSPCHVTVTYFPVRPSNPIDCTKGSRVFFCAGAISRWGSFQVYRAGNSGPVLFCLHGGGYTALTWACMVFTPHHLQPASSAVAGLPADQYQVVAMDMRGHGGTICADNTDYSVDTLSADMVEVAKALYGPDDAQWPKIVLVGHSMGGALAAHIAASDKLPSLAAVVVTTPFPYLLD
eukprot:4260287-Pyramimonas_sp.AAC.2